MRISEFRGDFQYLQSGSKESTCLGKSLDELNSSCCTVEAQTVTLSSGNTNTNTFPELRVVQRKKIFFVFFS